MIARPEEMSMGRATAFAGLPLFPEQAIAPGLFSVIGYQANLAAPDDLSGHLDVDRARDVPARNHGLAVDPSVYGYGRGIELPDESALIVYLRTGGHGRKDAQVAAL
jgi:hypothetical protein